jgi:RNA polymerase sigma factor (sigma-70 family)
MSPFDQDPSLLGRFRLGERRALEVVFRAYVQDVTDTLRLGLVRNLGGSSFHATWVADLVQDTFARAFAPSGLRGFDGVRPYGAYLATVARNVLIDWLRKRRRDEDLAGQPWVFVEPGAEEGDAQPPWDDPAVMALVNEYVAGLEEPLRSVYQKRYVDGLAQEGTATALGLSRQQVRTIEERLRKGLAGALQAHTSDSTPPTRLQAAK